MAYINELINNSALFKMTTNYTHK